MSDVCQAHVVLNAESPYTGGRISRRSVLRRGVFGAVALYLSRCGILPRGAWAFDPTLPPTKPAKAKAVIQIWMWGGPPHLDTFDPKPEAGNDYCGPFTGPIETNVSGIRINELLTELAKIADKYSLIRSMTHGVNAHETASYLVQTGRMPGDRIVYPAVGAVVSYFKGQPPEYDNLIPPYIVLTEPQGRFSEAGFLGPRFKPFATGGDPARTPFTVEGIVSPGITETRQRSRRELLQSLDLLRQTIGDDPQIQEIKQAEEQAYDLILGASGKAFDPSEEPQEVRQKYGLTTFGQSCLVARRLIERGVRYVTINYKGWDTHKENFTIMRRKLPEFDRGLANLIRDLADRGLLESTIVWCCGEFGRTPKIAWEAPWNGGRHHYGPAFSALVAGGGFKGGQVVGATDRTGSEVKDRPVYPTDLIATMYELLGIDPNTTIRHPQGHLVRLIPGPEDGAPSGGMLKEII